jgi:hypothetical protein
MCLVKKKKRKIKQKETLRGFGQHKHLSRKPVDVLFVFLLVFHIFVWTCGSFENLPQKNEKMKK